MDTWSETELHPHHFNDTPQSARHWNITSHPDLNWQSRRMAY